MATLRANGTETLRMTRSRTTESGTRYTTVISCRSNGKVLSKTRYYPTSGDPFTDGWKLASKVFQVSYRNFGAEGVREWLLANGFAVEAG